MVLVARETGGPLRRAPLALGPLTPVDRRAIVVRPRPRDEAFTRAAFAGHRRADPRVGDRSRVRPTRPPRVGGPYRPVERLGPTTVRFPHPERVPENVVAVRRTTDVGTVSSHVPIS
ncbi:hypothetical protein DSY14_23535 [Nocardiopsis sp. MG754419]|nr:hypothetical protein [Nocardiopsis sp. MG754419]